VGENTVSWPYNVNTVSGCDPDPTPTTTAAGSVKCQFLAWITVKNGPSQAEYEKTENSELRDPFWP